MMTPRILIGAVALAAATVTAPAALAVEAYSTYDNFPGSGPIDATKWSTWERGRKLVGGALNMFQREWGGTASDTGAQAVSWGEDLASPGRITQLKALIKVNAFDTNACAANTTANGFVRARFVSTFFNTGNPTSGNFTGDVLAQARVGRFSNSADPAGTLRVQGVLNLCTTSDCNQALTLGVVDLGTATIGQNVDLSMEWVKSLKKFIFRRDSNTIVAEIPYTVSDSAGPARPLQSIGLRVDTPNCATGPRTTGFIDANFDGVAINRSGKL
jgi:hypothetical protein